MKVSPSLINFLGLLNFKIQKKNKKIILETFDKIYDRALTNELQENLFRISKNLKKDDFFFGLAKLSIEVNRRLNIKNLFIYKMNKIFTYKKKKALKIFRLMSRGISYDPEKISVSETNSFIGNLNNSSGDYPPSKKANNFNYQQTKSNFSQVNDPNFQPMGTQNTYMNAQFLNTKGFGNHSALDFRKYFPDIINDPSFPQYNNQQPMEYIQNNNNQKAYQEQMYRNNPMYSDSHLYNPRNAQNNHVFAQKVTNMPERGSLPTVNERMRMEFEQPLSEVPEYPDGVYNESNNIDNQIIDEDLVNLQGLGNYPDSWMHEMPPDMILPEENMNNFIHQNHPHNQNNPNNFGNEMYPEEMIGMNTNQDMYLNPNFQEQKNPSFGNNTNNVFFNKYSDDCLYMNLEEEYMHKISMQAKNEQNR